MVEVRTCSRCSSVRCACVEVHEAPVKLGDDEQGSWTTMSTLSISSAEYDQNESPGGCCRVDSWSSSTSVTVRVLDGGVADYYESFFHHEVHELEYYDRTDQPMPRIFGRFVKDWGAKKAPEMYKAMRKWRLERGIDRILTTPYPNHWKMEQGMPHYVYGKARNGSYVSYEFMGMVDAGKLSKWGVTREDVEYDIAWHQEFARIRLEDGVQPRYMVVFDFKGFSLIKATNLLFLSLVCAYGETLAKYFPDVCERLVIVNPPFGISAILAVLLPVLPAPIREKVMVVKDLKGLQEWIAPEEIPVQYGGTNKTPLEESNFVKMAHVEMERANASSSSTGQCH